MAFDYFDPVALSKLSGLSLVARSIVEGFITGLHRSPYHGSSVEFAEYRKYTPGDDLRHLDWKVLAKRDRAYIRRYQEETNLKANIFLDVSRSMDYRAEADGNASGNSPLTKLDYARFLAASLSYLCIRQQDSVGLVVFDNRIRAQLPPKASAAHYSAILSALENVKSEHDTKLAPALHELAATSKKKGLAIIISDLHDDQSEILQAIKRFRHLKHEVIVFHVLGETEIEFPYTGVISFRDRETSRKVQINTDLFRAEYQSRLRAWTDSLRASFSESHVDYVLCNTGTRFDALLFEYLSKRSRAGV
ncbi:MAG: DUF58 domain-containing protein [Planctomycetes bacterium]|nr:DUF58 domain-containing protein [Planctomycetota bacterium]